MNHALLIQNIEYFVKDNYHVVIGDMNGILEQIFIEQAVSGIEQLRYDLMKLSVLEGGTDELSLQEWSVPIVDALDQLIIQFDQTELGGNFNHMINPGLNDFWETHSWLDKEEVLFCGVVASRSLDSDAAEFLQLELDFFIQTKESISGKLGLSSSLGLSHYVLNHMKTIDAIKK